MAVPPERISIKRRRQDDPVETLYLEQSNAHDSKRRFTDFFFQRLHQNPSDSNLLKSRSASAKATPSQLNRPSSAGIPLVRTTAPGDEIVETLRHKAAQRQRLLEASTKSQVILPNSADAYGTQKTSKLSESDRNISQDSGIFRRFRLTGHHDGVLSPNRSSGIRKAKALLRPSIAVFVEAYADRERDLQVYPKLQSNRPTDSFVEFAKSSPGQQDTTEMRAEDLVKPELIASRQILPKPFLQPKSYSKKLGHSIRDPPSTWDLDSDQLADELAALAMEIEEEDRKKDPNTVAQTVTQQHTENKEDKILEDSDFIYETYVRVSEETNLSLNCDYGSSREVGILVIEDQDEELWQTYIENEEDEGWDEEDADSNAEDNPANDYPEDEVSTDDEYGYDSYRYHQKEYEEGEYDY